jgi:predicted nucleotidyltransferase component of viral defense system
MIETGYKKQVELLLRVLPYIAKNNNFALKGGTGINFFIRDLPRLSVDIDLAYIPIKNRDESMSDITSGLKEISNSIKKILPYVRIQNKRFEKSEYVHSIIIENQGIVIKIEVNTVIRGSVFQVIKQRTKQRVEKDFGVSVFMNVLSFEDIYGGKICAALDRQHPRDLFDITLLLENEGLTEKIKQAFLFYLISHNRPIIELINPGLLDIKETFIKEFSGMSIINIEYEELIKTREKLIAKINSMLTIDDKLFLLSINNGTPDWGKYKSQDIKSYPSIQWKLMNINKMDSKKKEIEYQKLKEYFNI